MKKILLVFALLAAYQSFSQEQPVLNQEQQQVFNILFGINQTCLKKIANVPQVTINRVMEAVLTATEQDLLKPLFHIYRLCVNSLVYDQENVIITEDPTFLPHDLWATLIEEGFHRNLWSLDGIATAQVRDIFLACFIPFGSERYAIVDLSQINELDDEATKPTTNVNQGEKS